MHDLEHLSRPAGLRAQRRKLSIVLWSYLEGKVFSTTFAIGPHTCLASSFDEAFAPTSPHVEPA